jgi:hypothetical protein
LSESLLALLRLFLLALLYLFFLRVLRAVWVEVRSPPPAAGEGRRRPRRRRRAVTMAHEFGQSAALVITDPPEDAGRIYDLGQDEVSIGRAAACTVTLDDTFVSQLHARVFVHDNQIMAEDLGSTNGTYLNRQRLTGPMVMHPGDTVQVGNTILELR